MEDRFGLETSHLLLTHYHTDHCFAMEVFKDTSIVASKKCTEKIRQYIRDFENPGYCQRLIKYFKDDPERCDAIRELQLVVPNLSVKTEHRIGPEEHELIFKVTGGHSTDSAYIYSPSEKTLCAGDNLLSWYAQVVGNGALMMEVWREWETLDIDYVIPGHGDVVGKPYITRVRSYFDELVAALQKLKAQNLPIKEVLQHPSLPEYFGKRSQHWIEGGRFHQKQIDLAIKSFYRKIK